MRHCSFIYQNPTFQRSGFDKSLWNDRVPPVFYNDRNHVRAHNTHCNPLREIRQVLRYLDATRLGIQGT